MRLETQKEGNKCLILFSVKSSKGQGIILTEKISQRRNENVRREFIDGTTKITKCPVCHSICYQHALILSLLDAEAILRI